MVCGCTILRGFISSWGWWLVLSQRPAEWRIFPLEKLLSPLKQRICLRREAFCKAGGVLQKVLSFGRTITQHIYFVSVMWGQYPCPGDRQTGGIAVDSFSLWETILLLVQWCTAGEPDLSRVWAPSAAQSACWAAWGSLLKAGVIHCYAVLCSLGLC